MRENILNADRNYGMMTWEADVHCYFFVAPLTYVFFTNASYFMSLFDMLCKSEQA